MGSHPKLSKMDGTVPKVNRSGPLGGPDYCQFQSTPNGKFTTAIYVPFATTFLLHLHPFFQNLVFRWPYYCKIAPYLEQNRTALKHQRQQRTTKRSNACNAGPPAARAGRAAGERAARRARRPRHVRVPPQALAHASPCTLTPFVVRRVRCNVYSANLTPVLREPRSPCAQTRP